MLELSRETSERVVGEAERVAFEQNGFHVLRQALSQREVQVYREALVDLVKTPAEHPYAAKLMVAEIPGAPPTAINPRGVWAGFDLPLLDAIFWDFAFHPRITQAVSDLIGPDVNLFETSFVSKVPGFPGNYRDWHQDSEYSDPQSNESLVTVITYLDDQDGESGGTWVCPGTHREGALPHQVPSEAVSSLAREVADKARYDETGFCPTYQAGDTLIFKARLVHKSGANSTSRDRLSLAYNYCRADTLDLKQVNYYIGASTPVVRAGRPYQIGRTANERLVAHQIPEANGGFSTHA